MNRALWLLIIPMIQLPRLASGGMQKGLLVLTLLPFMLAAMAPMGRWLVTANPGHLRFHGDKRLALAALIWLGLWSFAVIRGAQLGVISDLNALYRLSLMGAVALFCLAVTWRPSALRQPIIGLYLGLALFCALNLLLYAAGVEGDSGDIFFRPSAGGAIMLGLFGIDGERAHFAMAFGINSFGVFPGALLVGGLLLLGRSRHLRWTAWVSILVGIAGILAVDSRGALVSAIGAVVLTRMGLVMAPRLLPWAVLVLPLGAVVMTGVIVTVSETTLGAEMARSADDVATFNGRGIMWAFAATELMPFSNRDLFGYGLHGHYASGAQILELDNRLAEYNSLHNTYLQHIFDVGYVGLASFLLLSFMVVNRIVKRWRCAARTASARVGYELLMGGMFFYLIYGNLEVSATVLSSGFPVFLLLVLLAGSAIIHPPRLLKVKVS